MARRARCALLLAPAVAAAAGRGNCRVAIPRLPGAPDDAFLPLVGELADEGREALDLEDLFMDDLLPEDYTRAKRLCERGDGPTCRTYGIGADQWNLTFAGLRAEGIQGTPCEEDFDVWRERCGADGDGNVVCKEIDGKVRIVGVRSEVSRSLLARRLSRLPHLFGLEVLEVSGRGDFEGLALPESLRIVDVLGPKALRPQRWAALAALLRAQGHVRSMLVQGDRWRKRWPKVDLAELCGLDLLRFAGYSVQVTGSTIPPCWSGMTNLRWFYCSNCMMTRPPTALKGLESLRSFVAFRQSEMVPCALADLADDPAKCKATWETRHAMKGPLRDSTGEWGDFHEGPSFSCPEAAYAFPFSEFLALGWTNVRKLWLDGNFLTGGIPESIADAMPLLDSLDLYSNRMEGPLPPTLGALPFAKLQLQENNFSGEVPRGVFRLLRRGLPMQLGLSENEELRGCYPQRVGGTRIAPCEHSDL